MHLNETEFVSTCYSRISFWCQTQMCCFVQQHETEFVSIFWDIILVPSTNVLFCPFRKPARSLEFLADIIVRTIMICFTFLLSLLTLSVDHLKSDHLGLSNTLRSIYVPYNKILKYAKFTLFSINLQAAGKSFTGRCICV